MNKILSTYANPRPTSWLAHIKSRAGLDRDYRHHVFRTHDELRVAERLMPPELFTDYFKFDFVRNPWARLVSEYEYLLRTSQHGRHAAVRKMTHFREFIYFQINRSDAYQFNMLTGANGEFLADFVGKFEHLDEDWQQACDKAGIQFKALPYHNYSARKVDFRAYFTSEDVELVAKHWSKEIVKFDYRFES